MRQIQIKTKQYEREYNWQRERDCKAAKLCCKSYDAHLMQRMRVFKKVTKTTKSLIPTFVTPYGLYNNAYSRKVPRQVTGNDLFEKI